jgi:hypothetical protein
MKVIKIVVIVFVVYAALVALFETWLGFNQPKGERTIVITTQDADGAKKDRVVARLDSDSKLYVAANHWPRHWYTDVLAHPEVQVTADGKTQAYVAVPVTGEEFEHATAEHPLGPVIRILTGFPPRRLVRLDPLITPAVPPSESPGT